MSKGRVDLSDFVEYTISNASGHRDGEIEHKGKKQATYNC